MVLCDGSVIRCSSEENSDLYYSVPWSYGTLGFLTAVEIKLIPAKKYVALSYLPINGKNNITKKFEEVSKDNRNEFVETIVYSKNEAVVMTGNQVDEAEDDKVKTFCVNKFIITYVRSI